MITIMSGIIERGIQFFFCLPFPHTITSNAFNLVSIRGFFLRQNCLLFIQSESFVPLKPIYKKSNLWMILWWIWRRWKVFRTIKIRQKAKCSNVCTYPAWQLINTINLYVKVDSSNMTQKLRTGIFYVEWFEKLKEIAILSIICKCWHKFKCFTASTTYHFHPSVTRR